MRGNVIDISPNPSSPDSVTTRMTLNSEALTRSLRFSPDRTDSFRGARIGMTSTWAMRVLTEPLIILYAGLNHGQSSHAQRSTLPCNIQRYRVGDHCSRVRWRDRKRGRHAMQRITRDKLTPVSDRRTPPVAHVTHDQVFVVETEDSRARRCCGETVRRWLSSWRCALFAARRLLRRIGAGPLIRAGPAPGKVRRVKKTKM